MKSVRTMAAASITLLAGAVACDRQTETVTRRLTPTEPSFAVVVNEYARYTPRQNANGVYLLDRLCDVFIGDPVPEPGTAAPLKYAHQTVVDVAPGSRIRVIGTPEMNRAGSKTFVCNARDDNGQPLIDPNTLHAAKGDGPQIFTDGVTLDMSGYSITVSPALGEEPGFENIGISLLGSDQTLMNSSTVDVAAADDATTGRKPGVTRIWGFGHNVDVEAVANPTVRGRRYNDDGVTINATGPVFNLETTGGMGVRLSGGLITVTQVKSVNLDPIEGQGFEARRSLPGSRTVVSNSHFEGGAEGVFVREYSGITLLGNYVSGHAGPGISTRESFSTADARIIFRNNTVENSTVGILWGRESVNDAGLLISGNTISQFTTCAIGLSTRAAEIAPLTLGGIADVNTINGTPRTCIVDD
jgi:hypothetical protein